MYWQGDVEWMACGTGAASFTGNVRFSRPKSLSKYFDFVEKLPQFDLNAEPNETQELLINTVVMT